MKIKIKGATSSRDVKNILDSYLSELGYQKGTHKLYCTILCNVYSKDGKQAALFDESENEITEIEYDGKA